MTSQDTSSAPAQPEPITQRFSRHAALRSEFVYGRGYQGPASTTVFAELAGMARVAPGSRVLDVGAGLGGDAFRLATRYHAYVVGLDIAPDMTQLCLERTAADGVTSVEFLTGDVLSTELAHDSFDVVWSRDCGMYLTPQGKADTWHALRQLLRCGGRVVLTDYCRGRQRGSAEFERHVAECGHHYATIEEYASLVTEAGLADVHVVDRTADLHESLVHEVAELARRRADFLARYSVAEYDNLMRRWERKLDFTAAGELIWLQLTATG